jgi:HAMP domain-containing protein
MMLRNLRLRKRFMVILIIIFFLSLPTIVFSTYYILRRNAEREIFESAKVFLFIMESIRKHIGEVTRPAVVKELPPDRFIVEAMSTSFNARGVAERVKTEFPHYIFKHISLNPRHLPNKSDNFEKGIINKFKEDRTLKELIGFTKKGDDEYFYYARPVISKEDCLRCHGSPEDAPIELIEKYGNERAFGWNEKEVVASLISYVPVRVAKENAIKTLIVFSSFYTGVFILVLIIIDRLMVGSIVKPVEYLSKIADEISLGKMDEKIKVDTNDEIKSLADSFTRMQRSVKAAIERLQKRREAR